jgi:hypothetical protein
MNERGSTRLGFLKRGVAATVVAGSAAGVASRGASARPRIHQRDRHLGTVAKVISDRSARVMVDAVGMIDLTLAPGAIVADGLRPDRSVGLATLRPSDRIAFQGSGSGRAMEATSVQVVYRRVSGVVIADEGSVVRTTRGDIVITAEVRRDLPSRLARGDTLSAAVRTNATARRLLAGVAERL